MLTLFKKYLELLGYDVANPKGSTCWFINIIDFALLAFYITIVIYNTWKAGTNGYLGISDLTYMATATLSFRTFLKFCINERNFKKDGISASITYTISIVVYLFLTALLIMGYFLFDNEDLSKILLILYYVLFAIFEITEILTRGFEATPHKYKK